MDSNRSRRKFVKTTFNSGMAAVALGVIPDTLLADPRSQATPFAQSPLPYAFNALEPHIDAMTMNIHYTKHAAAYTKNLNEAALAEFKGENTSLEDAFKNMTKYSIKLRNNGGGHYNHELFWKSMQAPGTTLHEGPLKQSLTASFGNYENFRSKMSEAALTRFGSGWAWLYLDGEKKLQIGSTPNQDNPLMDVSPVKGMPLLGLDVWEHAYYLKYQNKRADYVNNWFNLVNWKFVEERLLTGR